MIEMKLSEYIKVREEQLDKQMDTQMNQEKVSLVGIAVINSAQTELYRIKVLIEDGEIEGI